MIVILDTSVLGLITNRNTASNEVNNSQRWLSLLLARSAYIVTSDLCDYEHRRGLILASMTGGDSSGIKKLNQLRQDKTIDFLPVTSEVLLVAAEKWATAQTSNLPTTDKKRIDVDIILSAQWQLLNEQFPGRRVVIATTNIRHFSRFTDCQNWQNITY